MKRATWFDVVVLILGLCSMLSPRHSDSQPDFRAGGVSFGIKAHHQRILSIIESMVMILGGAGIAIAQRQEVPA
jgi:hypothetical protein